MEHIVLNKYGKPYKVGDEVIVVNPMRTMYDQIGEVHKVRNYDEDPRVSVVFECGNVYSFRPEDIVIN